MEVKFFTLGCKVNQYETEGLMEKFQSFGHTITKGKADLYVINTCTVTSRADTKSKEAILKAKRENPKAQIAVCGCLAQLNADSLKELGIDFIIPQEEKASAAEIILKKEMPAKNDDWSLKITKFFNQRAFVKVQDGCDSFCSFCKVPYVRGGSRSRPKKDIIEEIERLSLFHREIVLSGTNLALYGKDLRPDFSPLRPAFGETSGRGSTLDKLIGEILKISSLGRLRLSSLEPFSVPLCLLAHFSCKKMCPHLHFAFQSGADKVLKAMNKKEDAALYRKIVKKARSINPYIAISCDIMVGFPAEDKESFLKTISFLKETRPMRMHIFRFSPREMTPFSKMAIKNQKEVRQRYDYLKRLHTQFSLEYKKRFLGKTLSMITEQKEDGFICGYTENYIKVYLKEKVPLGQIVPVRIERMEGERVLVSLI